VNSKFKTGDWVYFKGENDSVHYGQIIAGDKIKWSCCDKEIRNTSEYPVKKATIEEMVLIRISGEI
jgi:uncharacterized pyridoxamine 5'-phosphate oxidase family protein